MTSTPSKPSHFGRAVSIIARDTFGGTPKSFNFYDDDRSHTIGMAEFVGAPAPGWTTHCTLTLHMTPNVFHESDIRVELVGVAAEHEVEMANVLATSAFYVMKNGWVASPGAVFEDMVSMYFPDTTTPHVMWTAPHPWPSLVDGSTIDGFGEVHWLVATPISDAERALLASIGYDEFDRRLGEAEVEYFDLHRQPLV